MKKILVLSCLLISAMQLLSQVIVSGVVKNAPADAEFNLSYYDNMFIRKEIILGKLKLSDGGTFSIKAPLSRAVVANLQIAKQYSRLYLEPGDSLKLTVDYNNFDSSIQYAGRGATNNNFLAAFQLNEFQRQASKYYEYTDADRYKEHVDSVETKCTAFMASAANKGLTPGFHSYISSMVRYMFIDARWMFRVKFDEEKRDYVDRDLPSSYFDFLRNIKLNDADALETGTYNLALERYCTEFNDDPIYKSFPDSLQDPGKNKDLIPRFYAFRKKTFSGNVLNYVLTSFMRDYQPYLLKNPELMTELLKDYRKSCTNNDYINIIDKSYTLAISLSPGKPAPAIKAVDEAGNLQTLASYAGKVLYIDFWATWCGPCRHEMPASAELQNKFKARQDIVFLYINVLDDRESWKKYLVKEKPGGVQLFADKEQTKLIQETYNFDGIPHYVLIDKAGKLINANAERPGNAEEDLLKALR